MNVPERLTGNAVARLRKRLGWWIYPRVGWKLQQRVVWRFLIRRYP